MTRPRGIARRQKFAVRAALGASRWRLARQVLLETGILALLGGCCATLIALWSLDIIRTISPANTPRFQETAIDPGVLVFTAGIGVVTTFLVGIWPALRISNNASMTNDLHDDSVRGNDGAHQRRAREIFVVMQMALAVVLLAGAGLTLKSFWRSQQVPLGFDPRGVLTMTIALPSSRYDSPEKIVRFYDQLLEKVKQLPGAGPAAICNNAPFDHEEWDSSFHITGTPPDPPGQEPTSEMAIVSPDYFRVLGMPMLRGRIFGPEDVSGRPGTIVIDELAAQRFFPGADPIGRQIDDPVTIGDNNQKAASLTIIGIVPHTRARRQSGYPKFAHDVLRRVAVCERRAESYGAHASWVQSTGTRWPDQGTNRYPRSRAGRVRDCDNGGEHRRKPCFATPNDDAAWGFWRTGAGPREYRALRRHGINCQPTHTRAGHSVRAWG